MIDSDAKAKSGEFYTAYRSYCMQVGDYIRSTTDFTLLWKRLVSCGAKPMPES